MQQVPGQQEDTDTTPYRGLLGTSHGKWNKVFYKRLKRQLTLGGVGSELWEKDTPKTGDTTHPKVIESCTRDTSTTHDRVVAREAKFSKRHNINSKLPSYEYDRKGKHGSRERERGRGYPKSIMTSDQNQNQTKSFKWDYDSIWASDQNPAESNWIVSS